MANISTLVYLNNVWVDLTGAKYITKVQILD
jgi:hypothetical protein